MGDITNTSNSNVTDDELIKQALRGQIEDIRGAKWVEGSDLAALSNALCNVVQKLKELS